MGTLLLIKEQLLVAHEAHYAGGIHLFKQLATSLSKHATVHVFTAAAKRLVIHYALMNGFLGRLQTTCYTSDVISWTDDSGVHYHVAIAPDNVPATDDSDSQVSSSRSSSSSHSRLPQHAALIQSVAAVATSSQHDCQFLLDVDSLQHVVMSSSSSSSSSSEGLALALPTTAAATCTSSCSSDNQGPKQQHHHHQQQQQQQQQPFMHALIQQLVQLHSSCCNHHHHHHHDHHLQQQQQQQQQQCSKSHSQQSHSRATPTAHTPHEPKVLMLVQNIYQLPFGPCGTAPRTPQVLSSWQQVSGLICVSGFVKDYVMQHVLPLIGLSSDRVYVMHPAAVGVFGKGPWDDLGQVAADRLWGQQQQQQQQQHRQQRPVVGMLKCSPEKGSDLFLGLAARLPQYDFLAVSADPALQQQAAAAAAAGGAAGLCNLSLIPPDADVSRVLQRMSVVLVPSVLHEAFGLVVLDALLHGIPVIISEAGALEEAAAGAAAAVLPAKLVQFPTAAAAAAAAAADAAGKGGQQPGVNAVSEVGLAADDLCGPHSGAEHGSVSLQQQQQQQQQWEVSRRHWHDRAFPAYGESDYDAWVLALGHVLSSRAVYMGFSEQGRQVAQGFIRTEDEQLRQLVEWLGVK